MMFEVGARIRWTEYGLSRLHWKTRRQRARDGVGIVLATSDCNGVQLLRVGFPNRPDAIVEGGWVTAGGEEAER